MWPLLPPGSRNCGLYYKHMMNVNDNSSVFIKWSSKLIDTARGIIYDWHMFIEQATGSWFILIILKIDKSVNYEKTSVFRDCCHFPEVN